MRYITGIHALNLPCALDTCGDWHCSAIQWVCPTISESNDSIYGMWGIELDRIVPEHKQHYPVANHLRALLDLIAVGDFSNAQGAANDFICNDDYTSIFMQQVLKLKNSANWPEICAFMEREYKLQWLDFLDKEKSDD